MAKKNIEEIVTGFVLPITERHSYELVDVEFIREGAHWYLRVYIDKPDGITIDDCQIVSEELSEQMDKEDPIEQSYFLEVSSPGLDRPLKKDRDFEKYKGELVEVKVFQPINGQKVFEGELAGLKDGKILINKGNDIIEFERDGVAAVRRVIKFK